MVEKCLVTDCRQPAAKRGMCLLCYAAAEKKVEANETTWDRLVGYGLCRPEVNPFDDAFEKAVKKARGY